MRYNYDMDNSDTTIEVTQMLRRGGVPQLCALQSVQMPTIELETCKKVATIYGILILSTRPQLSAVLNALSSKLNQHEPMPLLVDLTFQAQIASELELTPTTLPKMVGEKTDEKTGDSTQNQRKRSGRGNRSKLRNNKRQQLPESKTFDKMLYLDDMIDYNSSIPIIQQNLPEYKHFKVLSPNFRKNQPQSIVKLQDIINRISADVAKMFVLLSVPTLHFPELTNMVDKLIIVSEVTQVQTNQALYALNLASLLPSSAIQLIQIPRPTLLSKFGLGQNRLLKGLSIKQVKRQLRRPIAALKQVQL
jgi:hypothetical protein